MWQTEATGTRLEGYMTIQTKLSLLQPQHLKSTLTGLSHTPQRLYNRSQRLRFLSLRYFERINANKKIAKNLFIFHTPPTVILIA